MTRKVHNSYAAFRDRTAAWPRVGDENLALGDPAAAFARSLAASALTRIAR